MVARRMLLLELLGGGTALLGVLAILLLRRSQTSGDGSASQTISVVQRAQHRRSLAAKPKQIHWSVQTTPPGTRIVRVSDGQILGGTPMELDQSASDGACEVKLKLPGFADKVIKLSLSDKRDTQRDARQKPRSFVRF